MSIGTSGRITTVQMIGRLGNNFFQFAAGQTIQSMFGGELQFFNREQSTRDDVNDIIGQHVHLGTRGVGRDVSMGENRGRVHRGRRRIVRELRFALGDLEWLRFKDPFAPFPVDVSESLNRHSRLRSIFLWGFFQHPSWFEPSLNHVTARIWETLEPLVHEIRDSGATVVSVRRGDYVRLGWDLPMDYYERALEELGPVDGPVWLVSDDPTIDNEFAPVLAQFGMTAEPLPDLAVNRILRDLALLGSAQSVVASNSTFCWWGVVAGQMQSGQESKRIIAPAQWLPLQGSNALLRADWKQINHTKWGNGHASE